MKDQDEQNFCEKKTTQKNRKETEVSTYLIHMGLNSRNVQIFQLVQTQETIIHNLGDRVASQAECPQMMHRVPGRGWWSW